jgi:replicative DNA helicase
MIDRTKTERALLGCIMVKPDTLIDIRAILEPKDFGSREHRIIYESALTVSKKNKTVDYATLTDELETSGRLQDAGGDGYLIEIAQGFWTASMAQQYAQEVKEAAQTRRIHDLCLETSENIQHGDERGPVTIAAELGKRISDIVGQKRDQTEWRQEDMCEQAEIIATESKPGFPTGYPALDRHGNGLQGGDMIILGARPSVGKTALAINIAVNVMDKKGCVAFVSVEMGKPAILARMMSVTSGIALAKVLGKKSPGENEQLATRTAAAASRWEGFNLLGDCVIDIPRIRSFLTSIHRERHIDLVVVDYIQLMKVPGFKGNRVGEVSEISRELKLIAKEYGTTMLALSQLSRDNEKEKRKPVLSDLRDSGSIEQDADQVWFLHRPFKDAEATPGGYVHPDDAADLIIAKNRQGKTGTIKLTWDGSKTLFKEEAYGSH